MINTGKEAGTRVEWGMDMFSFSSDPLLFFLFLTSITFVNSQPLFCGVTFLHHLWYLPVEARYLLIIAILDQIWHHFQANEIGEVMPYLVQYGYHQQIHFLGQIRKMSIDSLFAFRLVVFHETDASFQVTKLSYNLAGDSLDYYFASLVVDCRLKTDSNNYVSVKKLLQDLFEKDVRVEQICHVVSASLEENDVTVRPRQMNKTFCAARFNKEPKIGPLRQAAMHILFLEKRVM